MKSAEFARGVLGTSMQTRIAPSILSGDFAKLAQECKRMTELVRAWRGVALDVFDLMVHSGGGLVARGCNGWTLCVMRRISSLSSSSSSSSFRSLGRRPNLTIGAPVVASLRPHTNTFLDVHLMVSNPEQWVQDFAKGAAFC